MEEFQNLSQIKIRSITLQQLHPRTSCNQYKHYLDHDGFGEVQPDHLPSGQFNILISQKELNNYELQFGK